MTTLIDTRPYCGQCGWDPANNGLGGLEGDLICDADGADLSRYGFVAEPFSTAAVTLTAPPDDATKPVLLQWLSDQGVTGVQALTKGELWDLINDLLD